jgi:hypothetical protein
MGDSYLMVNGTRVDLTPEQKEALGVKEPDPKPMAEFYCYKDDRPGEWLTKGKTYCLDAEGRLTYDNGHVTPPFKSVAEYAGYDPGFFSCLATQVKRPARFGEWVLVTKGGSLGSHTQKGDIRLAFESEAGDTKVDGNDYGPGVTWWIRQADYLVLDHYHPDEPKKKHPLERVEACEKYVFINTLGGLTGETGFHEGRYAVANTAADTPEGREILNKWSLRDTLCHLMRRYAEMHGGEPEVHQYFWTFALTNAPGNPPRFSIHPRMDSCYNALEPRFASEDAVKGCVEQVVKPFLSAHPDFKW